MKYDKIKLYSYNLHVIKTDKFKTITVKVNFKRKLTKEDITYRNMLVNVLCESTKKYPTKRLMEIATEDLYELGYRGSNYISGKYGIMGLDITFLNEKYTEKGMLEKSIDFLSQMLFEPNLTTKRNGKEFDKENFKISYNILKNGIKGIKESPAIYSKIRMLENMEPNSPISYRNYGYLEDLKKINEKKLYEYYKSVLTKDTVDIFVIGDVNKKEIERIINEKFKIKTLKKPNESHFILPKKKRLFAKTIKEKQNLNQSQLVMGLKIDKMTDFELRYVLNIYSYILGGGPDSKLFRNVREKNSLCYSINSVAYPLGSILTISAGINSKDFKKAVLLIKKEIKKMSNGIFTDEDIIKAKVTYMNSIKELEDNPENLLSMYIGMEYLKSDDIPTRITKINKVTRSNIIKLASKIHLDTVYLLEGGDVDAEK